MVAHSGPYRIFRREVSPASKAFMAEAFCCAPAEPMPSSIATARRKTMARSGGAKPEKANPCNNQSSKARALRAFSNTTACNTSALSELHAIIASTTVLSLT
eukprot:scaffold564_cov64-Phaeocystis_antarctica.AAC.1